MKITPATAEVVELNRAEIDTQGMFEFLRKIGGMSVQAAAEEALSKHHGKPSKEFVEWLSEGTLTKTDGDITPAA